MGDIEDEHALHTPLYYGLFSPVFLNPIFLGGEGFPSRGQSSATIEVAANDLIGFPERPILEMRMMNHSSSWEVSTQTLPMRGKNPLVEFCGEKGTTPPKTNIEPENGPLGKGVSFSKLSFSGSMLIFRGVPSLKLT